MNGSSDAKAIVLDDIPIEEFRALLYYFYHEYVTRSSGLKSSVLSTFWIQTYPQAGASKRGGISLQAFIDCGSDRNVSGP